MYCVCCIRMVFRGVDLHSYSSIPAVPELLWSRNEATAVAEVQLQHTPLTSSTSHLQTVSHRAHFGLLGQGQAGTQGWHKGQDLSSVAIDWRQKEGLACWQHYRLWHSGLFLFKLTLMFTCYYHRLKQLLNLSFLPVSPGYRGYKDNTKSKKCHTRSLHISHQQYPIMQGGFCICMRTSCFLLWIWIQVRGKKKDEARHWGFF